MYDLKSFFFHFVNILCCSSNQNFVQFLTFVSFLHYSVNMSGTVFFLLEKYLIENFRDCRDFRRLRYSGRNTPRDKKYIKISPGGKNAKFLPPEEKNCTTHIYSVIKPFIYEDEISYKYIANIYLK